MPKIKFHRCSKIVYCRWTFSLAIQAEYRLSCSKLKYSQRWATTTLATTGLASMVQCLLYLVPCHVYFSEIIFNWETGVLPALAYCCPPQSKDVTALKCCPFVSKCSIRIFWNLLREFLRLCTSTLKWNDGLTIWISPPKNQSEIKNSKLKILHFWKSFIFKCYTRIFLN